MGGKAKKILAREGLILMGFILAGLCVYLAGRHLNNIYLSQHQDAMTRSIHNMKYRLLGYSPYLNTIWLGKFIAVFGYPLTGVLRFGIWGFRQLREAE